MTPRRDQREQQQAALLAAAVPRDLPADNSRRRVRWIETQPLSWPVVEYDSLPTPEGASTRRNDGCWDAYICLDENGWPGHWVEPDLSSACVQPRWKGPQARVPSVLPANGSFARAIASTSTSALGRRSRQPA